MARRGREVCVLADATKPGSSPFPYHALPERPWTLLTDGRAEAEAVREFATTELCTVITA